MQNAIAISLTPQEQPASRGCIAPFPLKARDLRAAATVLIDHRHQAFGSMVASRFRREATSAMGDSTRKIGTCHPQL
jgi:hypothetical protein